MKIGIIGLGYVGQPLALRFTEVGVPVLGFDIDKSKVDALNAGESLIEHIPATDIQNAIKNGFEATADFSRIGEADALLIAVPTPLDKHNAPDLSYVTSTLEMIKPFLRKGQLLTLESTTYPGTTTEIMRPIVEGLGFKVGEDFYVAYSPEREDPGNPDFTTQTIPKVVGGETPACTAKAVEIYEKIIDKVVPVSSTRAAELVKLLENIYRAVNIGLVNEMKIVADKMDIDIFEVINAAATKPFGFKAFYPGPGLGGHCIPIDPFYLTWKAHEYGVHTRFIELAGEINKSMPEWVVRKVAFALNEEAKAIKGSRILALGVAYKKNVDDMRESPSLDIIELLMARGGAIDYSDPHVASLPPMREHNLDMSSVDLTPETLASYDCVLLLTDHDRFDKEMIAQHSKLLVDTRGFFEEATCNLVKA